METPSIEEKIKIIEESDELTSIAVKYLPDVFSNEYIFISYSHRDYKKVYKDLLLLTNEGINVWYDREMAAGKSWIDLAIQNMTPYECKAVIFYLSENALTSQAVISELEFSKKTGRTLITIMMPFEHDYIYNGKSVKGQCFHASKMLEIMANNGVKIPSFEEKNVKLNEYFPDDVLYLTLDEEPSRKANLIKNGIKQIPLLETDDSNGITPLIIKLNDINATKVKVEVGEDLDDTVVIKSCAFTGASYLKEIYFDDYSYEAEEFAFANCKSLERIICHGSGVPLLSSGSFYNDVNIKEFYRDGEFINSCQISGERVFYNCKNLETIHCEFFSEIDKQICVPNSTFYGCTNLKEVELGRIERIEEYAFARCSSLKFVEVHEDCEYIGNSAFLDCAALQTFEIGDRVSLIESSAFTGCTSLHAFVVDEKNINYCDINGILYSKNQKTLYCIPEGYKGAVSIPAKTDKIQSLFIDRDGISMFIVDNNNKHYSSLDGALYSKGYEYLYAVPNAFEGCFVVPDFVLIIGHGAFKSLKKIKKVVIGKGVNHICEDAFEDAASIEEFEVDKENNTYMSYDGTIYTKNGKKLVSVPLNKQCETFEILDGTEEILDGAFNGDTSFKTIIIPQTIKSISTNYLKFDAPINKIIYKGTIKEFNAIKNADKLFENEYLSFGEAEQIICSDGVIELYE